MLGNHSSLAPVTASASPCEGRAKWGKRQKVMELFRLAFGCYLAPLLGMSSGILSSGRHGINSAVS